MSAPENTEIAKMFCKSNHLGSSHKAREENQQFWIFKAEFFSQAHSRLAKCYYKL